MSAETGALLIGRVPFTTITDVRTKEGHPSRKYLKFQNSTYRTGVSRNTLRFPLDTRQARGKFVVERQARHQANGSHRPASITYFASHTQLNKGSRSTPIGGLTRNGSPTKKRFGWCVVRSHTSSLNLGRSVTRELIRVELILMLLVIGGGLAFATVATYSEPKPEPVGEIYACRYELLPGQLHPSHEQDVGRSERAYDHHDQRQAHGSTATIVQRRNTGGVFQNAPARAMGKG